MTLDVPEPVAKYLAAEEAKDADALSRCFTEDGTVHDENSGLFWGFWGLSEGFWDQYWDQVSPRAMHPLVLPLVHPLVSTSKATDPAT